MAPPSIIRRGFSFSIRWVTAAPLSHRISSSSQNLTPSTAPLPTMTRCTDDLMLPSVSANGGWVVQN
uniref:Uncharacterized protein n=1 Tax=Arundo donax TaxID=35708 RepID=A0A0A9D8F3_ARUDO